MRLIRKNRRTMRRTTYFEDWSETNPNEFGYDAIDERLGLSTEKRSDDGRCDILPGNFDYSLFDSEQQEYIAEYLAWYRKDSIQHLLSFLLKPTENLTKNSERSRKAVMMKVFCRNVLLHKLLNDPDVGYRDLPKTFGISNHCFYDTRKEMLSELIKQDKNIEYILCNNRHLK